MAQELPQEKLIVGLASFGLGLILSGQFLFGLLPIAAAVYFYIKNRAAYAHLEKRLTTLLGAEKSTGSGAPPKQPSDKAARPEAVASTPSAPPDNWYYERAGAAIGPFKESDIRSLSRSSITLSLATSGESLKIPILPKSRRDGLPERRLFPITIEAQQHERHRSEN